MWDSQLRGTEPVVPMVIDVRRAHFYSAALRTKCLWSSLQKHARTRAKLDVCSEACIVAEALEWIGNSRFARDMTAVGFVQGRASERQLRVCVHGNDFVRLSYIINVKWFFTKLQEFWVGTNRGILGPSGYHDSVHSIRVPGRIVDWTADRQGRVRSVSRQHHACNVSLQ